MKNYQYYVHANQSSTVVGFRVSDLNTFSVNYIYINEKYEDLGDSSDKYRTDEIFVNIIKLGFITNL